MEAESFRNPDIAKILNRDFVAIRVYMDKEGEISREYFVRALPTSWFLEPDGTRITNIPGYANPATFLVILNYIKSESYKRMSLKEYWDSRR